MKNREIDPRLRETLRVFAESYLAKREAAFEGLDFEKLRDRLAECRERAVLGNKDLLLRFEEEALRRGSRVLRAADSEEADRIVLEILRRHGVRKLVKAKSMVSEEIRLNDFLERNGLEPRETDLGEWIVQLERERPTHMVMPAIHLTREDVARIFARYLGKDVPSDIPSLVRVAREELRREIFQAGAGLTGANALVAENGSIMLVTNEGNGRLVSTVPSVHIVLASPEKVVETTADALLILRLLTRSATGQPVSSYVSFLAGPRREAQYIVLVDNGRGRIAEDATFRDILRCIKCSACLNVCPVYGLVGGRRFAHIYMGGIGALLTAWIHGLRASKDLAGLCLGCHRCEAYCPAKIPVGSLVIALKEKLNLETGATLWKRLAFDGFLARPGLQKAAFGAARKGRILVSGKGFARRLPPGLRRLDVFRALPAPAAASFSSRLRSARPEVSAGEPRKSKGRIIIFPGCLVENIYPEVGLAAARVLNKLGYDVVSGPASCCGFPAANSGHGAAALKAYRRLLCDLSGSMPVITLCPTCTVMLTGIGPDLLKKRMPVGAGQATPGSSAEEAGDLARRVSTFSRFLAGIESEALRGRLSGRGRPMKISYHDSCHHKYVLKAGGASREILSMLPGAELVEMANSESCCGFGGVFSADHPGLSAALLEDKLASIRATGADIVAMDCPGCLLQVRGGCQRSGDRAEVRHTAELLADGLD